MFNHRGARTALAWIIVLLLVACAAALVWACTVQVVFGPDGTMYQCTTCPGPVPTTTCLPIWAPPPPPPPLPLPLG
jgi:hypothetical protein